MSPVKRLPGLATMRFVLALCLSSLVAACGAREPQPAELPKGVDRNARPEIIIKGKDVYWNGHLIQPGKTLASEVEGWIDHKLQTQQDDDDYLVKNGVRFVATEFHDLPGKPRIVHRFEVWLNQQIDYGKSRSCTPDEVVSHQASIRERLAGLTKEEQEHGWAPRDAMKAELLAEPCVRAGMSPDSTFTGYLEVDGLPLSPTMNFQEIQTRRKELGLLPLRVHQASGPPLFIAPREKNEPWAFQKWNFVFPTRDGEIYSLPVVWISVP